MEKDENSGTNEVSSDPKRSDSSATEKSEKDLENKESSPQPKPSQCSANADSAKDSQRKDSASGRHRQQKWTQKPKASDGDLQCSANADSAKDSQRKDLASGRSRQQKWTQKPKASDGDSQCSANADSAKDSQRKDSASGRHRQQKWTQKPKASDGDLQCSANADSAKDSQRKDSASGRNRQQKWTQKSKASDGECKSTLTTREDGSHHRESLTSDKNDTQTHLSGPDRRLRGDPRGKRNQPEISHAHSHEKKGMQPPHYQTTGQADSRKQLPVKASHRNQRQAAKDKSRADHGDPSPSAQTLRGGHEKRKQKLHDRTGANERSIKETPPPKSNGKITATPREKQSQLEPNAVKQNKETGQEPQPSRHNGNQPTGSHEKHGQSIKQHSGLDVTPSLASSSKRKTGSGRRASSEMSAQAAGSDGRAQNPILAPRRDRREENAFVISDILYELDETSERLLQNHERKGRSIKQQLQRAKRKMKDLFTHEEGKREVETLQQKQDELKKQKEEFTEARDRLKTELRSLGNRMHLIEGLWNSFLLECHRFDTSLPVYARRREIVQLVQDNQVSIILGETGSGKSTQLVQYLHDAGGLSGTIVCTQPRKVAAISLASQVAKEMWTRLGDTVGYKVGSQRKRCPRTRILFMTDHSFLNECLADPELRDYSCIIVDEAHERSLYTDLLLSMIKRCLPRRPDLRVVITSATIDPAVFQQFFGGCPVIRATGRNFPVDVVWPDEEVEQDDYCENAVSKVIYIHTQEKPGDVLTFVTSPAETEKCCQLLKERLKMRADFICLQLHGKQQAEDQQKVFMKTPNGKRKLVFAANCAETSITIDGICYVVDTGRAKEMCYDPRRNLNSLCLSQISKSSADQRKGRAGRTAPGKCYRLYSENTYNEMELVSLPEILRIHLGHALLKLAELGVDRETYEFVQSPSEERIVNAMEMLHVLGALSDGTLTEKGRWIARLPFDPRLGLLTYMGREEDILYDCIVLAAVMSAEGGIFYRGTGEKEQRIHDLTKLKFSLDKGDSLSCMAIFKTWLRVPDKEKNTWCAENGFNAKTLRGIKETVGEICRVLELKSTSCTFSKRDETERLRKLIVRCYSSNLCHNLGRDGAGYYAAHASRKVHIHPSSCLNALASAPEWVVFDQLIQTSRDFITGVTPVEESWLDEMDEKILGFNPAEVRRKTVQKCFSRQVGSRAFSVVVGPSYSKLRQLEADFPAPPGSVVFVEALREVSEISVYSTEGEDQTEALTQHLETTIDEAVREMESEDREEAVAGNAKHGVRVVVGQGGAVTEVLMPSQTRKIIVSLTSDLDSRAANGVLKKLSVTEDMIREKFSQYGPIKFCKKFERGMAWGFVIFTRSADAVSALQEEALLRMSGYSVQHSITCSSLLKAERRRPAKEAKIAFNLQLTWARPCLKYALVDLSSSEVVDRCLQLGVFHVGEHTLTVTQDEGERVCILGVTDSMTADLVRRRLLSALGEPDYEENAVLDVHISRGTPLSTPDDDLTRSQRQIEDFFVSRVPNRLPHILVHEPQDYESHFRATVRFRDPTEGHEVYERIERERTELRLDGELVAFTPFTRIETEMQANLLENSHEDLNDTIAFLAEQDVRVERRTYYDEAGTTAVVVSARSMAEAVEARKLLDAAVRGVVVDCSNAQVLFTPDGTQLIETLRQETGATAAVDWWTRSFTIRGPRVARDEMHQRLTDLKDKLHGQTTAQHELRGEGRPPGLMKAMLLVFGENLHGLLSVAGLRTATLNFRSHRLIVAGTPESLDKTADLVAKITEDVSSEATTELHQRQDARPTEKCSVCMCCIEMVQLHRLELCAHPYCKDCFKQMVRFAVQNRAVPVLCCHENCERPLALRDFKASVRDGHLTMEALVKAAVTRFVNDNAATYRHCPTSDCPGLYRITEPVRGHTYQRLGYPRGVRGPGSASYVYGRRNEDMTASNVYVCPACNATTCTACHQVGAHSGQPCSAGNRAEGATAAATAPDKSFQDWAAEDPDNRKQCPKCRHMIDKDHGCNKMKCVMCKTIFCWVCREMFSSASSCEDHLVLKHGGIFPPDYEQRDNRYARARPRRF